MARGSNRAGPVDVRVVDDVDRVDVRRARGPAVACAAAVRRAEARAPAPQRRDLAGRARSARPDRRRSFARRLRAAHRRRLPTARSRGSPAEGVLAAARAEAIDPFELAARLAFPTASGLQREVPEASRRGPARDRRRDVRRARRRRRSRPELRPFVDDETAARSRRRTSPWARSCSRCGARRTWRRTRAFGGVPHRDAVSHFVWGRRGAQQRPEDLVLTARRRMLAAYAGRRRRRARDARQDRHGLAARGAAPRVATSGPGDERDGGARQHRGLDLTASVGEPVRAAADGVVAVRGPPTSPGSRALGRHPALDASRTTRTAASAWAASTSASIREGGERKVVTRATCTCALTSSPRAITSRPGR